MLKKVVFLTVAVVVFAALAGGCTKKCDYELLGVKYCVDEDGNALVDGEALTATGSASTSATGDFESACDALGGTFANGTCR